MDIPQTPYLEKVSIHHLTGEITLAWDTVAPQGKPSVDDFILYWYETEPVPNYIPFDTVQKTVLEHRFFHYNYPGMPDPRETSIGFSVTALHRTPKSNSLLSFRHHNIQVTNAYDSCRSRITLNWHHYQGWAANTQPWQPLVGYEVIRIHADGSEEVMATTAALTHTIPDVKDRDDYTFYIRAKRSDEETSTSYRTVRKTNMPIPPDTVIALGTRYNSEGLAEIAFKIDPAAQTHSYRFSGSSRPEYAFVSLGTFDIYGDTVLTDRQFRGKTHYYRLEAWHICMDRITAESNTATALWLALKQESSVNLLQWDPYRNWGEDARYEVYRKIGDADSTVIYTILDPETTAFRDDLSNELIDGKVCYWINATPVSSGSPEKTAISNRVCIIPESNIWIPQAFTPNDVNNAINQKFKPFFSYPPKEYELYLYDRTGAKVFETRDIEEGWNGLLLNGKPANEGVYVYYLKFRTELGRLVEKKGTFSLILP